MLNTKDNRMDLSKYSKEEIYSKLVEALKDGANHLENVTRLIKENNKLQKQLSLQIVSKSFIAGDVVEITGWIHGHEFELGEKVTLIEKDAGLWVSKNKDGVQWYISEEEANVC